MSVSWGERTIVWPKCSVRGVCSQNTCSMPSSASDNIETGRTGMTCMVVNGFLNPVLCTDQVPAGGVRRGERGSLKTVSEEAVAVDMSARAAYRARVQYVDECNEPCVQS